MRRSDALTEEQRALAADPRYLGYAKGVAAKWGRTYPHLADDLLSAAMLGLVLAARSYNPNRGVPFMAYVSLRVSGTMKDVLKTAPGHVSLEHSLTTDDVDGVDESIPSGDLPVGWEVESEDEVFALTRGLDIRLRTVVLSLMLDARSPTLRAYGELRGITESWASKLFTEAKKCLVEVTTKGGA